MKVIFLDIDGVLNNHASLAEGIHVENSKSQLIGRIVDETDARIVVSSTWRLNSSIESLNTLLWCTGGPFNSIIGVTPRLDNVIRGIEIQEWMKDKKDITKYIIIDDDSDMLPEQMPFFIKTYMQSGLTTRMALEAIKILNA